jgi:hypothetical protein
MCRTSLSANVMPTLPTSAFGITA